MDFLLKQKHLVIQLLKEKWPCEICPVGDFTTRQFSLLGPLLLYLDPITTTTEVSVQNLIEYYDLSLKLNLIQN